jgi:hypothetical protein
MEDFSPFLFTAGIRNDKNIQSQGPVDSDNDYFLQAAVYLLISAVLVL